MADCSGQFGAEKLSFDTSGQVEGFVVDKDTMPEKGEHNWPEDELDSFLDHLGAGDGESGRLIDRLPVIIYASELGENGRWRYVSPQVEEILGFTPEEFLRDPGLWARQLHQDDRMRALGGESLGALGNVVAQLHVHIVGRFRSDPAWPQPVWGSGAASPYPVHAAASLADRAATLFAAA